MVCGHGAIAAGGPDARHSSTGSANWLSEEVYPGHAEQLVQWEVFHRFGGSVPTCSDTLLLSQSRGGFCSRFRHGPAVWPRDWPKASFVSGRLLVCFFCSGGSGLWKQPARRSSNVLKNLRIMYFGLTIQPRPQEIDNDAETTIASP